MIINKIIISEVAPNSKKKEVGWLLPLEDDTFKLKFYGLNGWIDASSGTQGAAGPAGADGKSLTAIELTVDAEGNVTGGTATLSDKSTIDITVTKSEG
jgi:hypothetical protein